MANRNKSTSPTTGGPTTGGSTGSTGTGKRSGKSTPGLLDE
jgi:hypothetical protein